MPPSLRLCRSCHHHCRRTPRSPLPPARAHSPARRRSGTPRRVRRRGRAHSECSLTPKEPFCRLRPVEWSGAGGKLLIHDLPDNVCHVRTRKVRHYCIPRSHGGLGRACLDTAVGLELRGREPAHIGMVIPAVLVRNSTPLHDHMIRHPLHEQGSRLWPRILYDLRVSRP